MRSKLVWGCLLFVACTRHESNDGCNSNSTPPGSLGPIPEFRAVANAPSEIMLLAIAPSSRRPIVAARDGLFRYDGNDAWTTGPALDVERFIATSDRMFALASGMVHELDGASFTWTPLGNPSIATIIGVDPTTETFIGQDTSSQLFTWTAGDTAWAPVVGSTIPEPPVEAAVGPYGAVYRLTDAGNLYVTVSGSSSQLAQDPLDPFPTSPHHLTVDRSGNVLVCAGGSVYQHEAGKPHFLRWTGGGAPCDKLQLMPDDSLVLFVSTDDEFSGQFLHLADDGTFELRRYMSTEYDYICGDVTPGVHGTFYGAMPIVGERSFIESLDFGTF